ncbi:MAG: Ig-like domain-containing protein, partial [Candidatus Sifarchaeia archaeon]
TNTFILDFLNNFYGIKPGETVTLSGTISSNENGQLITITLEGETYTTYTFNNGEFEVTVTAPNIYGSYPVTAKFAGDSNWESTSTTCQLLVVEEETQMTFDIDGNPDIGEQMTIQTTLTTENGELMPGEKVTIYIYEQKNSISTSSFSTSSSVGVFSADTRYWDLIATYEVITDENSNAIIVFTIPTDKDIQIVGEYAGKIEGEGGENLGPSIITYVEGENTQTLFAFTTSEFWYLFGGILAIVIMSSLILVMKPNLRPAILQREKIEEIIVSGQEIINPNKYGIKAVFMVVFDPVVGPMIKESRLFDFNVEIFKELWDPGKLMLETNELIFVKAATTLIINEADMTVLGETIAPNLLVIVTKKECDEKFVWEFIKTVLVGWSDQQGYLVHQMDRISSEYMIELRNLSLL